MIKYNQSLMARELVPIESPERRYLVANEEIHLQQKRNRMQSRKAEILAQIVDSKLLEKYTQGDESKGCNTNDGANQIYSCKDQYSRECFNANNYTIRMNDNFKVILSRKNAVIGPQGVPL